MKKILVIAFALAMVAGVSAQEKEVVKFNETTHDFGTVKEEVGRVTYVFDFTNLTSKPLTMTSVRASCGCTTPNWSREPVAPNSDGEITVTYHTSGRPGSFRKSITVNLSDGTNTYTKMVYIKGHVTPRPTQTVEQVEPIQKKSNK